MTEANKLSAEMILPPLEEIADAIMRLSEVGRAIGQTRLRQDAIILLLQQITKVTRSDIQYVLNALPELERTYLRPKPVAAKAK